MLQVKQQELEMMKLDKQRVDVENEIKRSKAQTERNIKEAQANDERESGNFANGRLVVAFDPNIHVTIKSAYLKKKILYKFVEKGRQNLFLKQAGTRAKQLFIERKHIVPSRYTMENEHEVLVYQVEDAAIVDDGLNEVYRDMTAGGQQRVLPFVRVNNTQ